MRFLVFLLILPFVLLSGNVDSLANNHYKVRFNIQTKYSQTQFDYISVNGQANTYATYSEGMYWNYDGKISSNNTLNPEIKIDFELPIWLKITCGFNYNKIKYYTRSQRVNYSKYNIYDPHSTQANPIVIGFNKKENVEGYNVDEREIIGFGSFIGLGISKNYKRFNFDLDYSFSSYKVTEAYCFTKEYDINNSYQKTEGFYFMDNYIHQFGWLIFSHNVSSSISWNFYKRTSIKLGAQYSIQIGDIEDETYSHYSLFKNQQSYFLIFGLSFSIR